jgi:hypothetical protein
MSAEPRPAAPTLAAYAAQRGLYHRAPSMALPQATQLLRHGFMREVPSLVRGDLPGGLRGAWLAQVDYVFEGRSDLERSYFTLVLVQAPESLGFAVRVLCHDRGLTKLDMTNPDSDREVIEMPDHAVKLESEAFLRRYSVFTDNDQDELSVWRLFAPTLIDWLANDAPAGFSMELQDGALCCFVPGTLSADAEIDALCGGAGRVLEEVARIGEEGGAAAAARPDDRRTRIDEELAAHPFDEPPKDVKHAAKAFRHGPFIGDDAWKLGGEAFFREAARAAGFEPIAISAYRASHLDTFLPGEIANAAVRGETFLVTTDNGEYDDMGWTSLIAPLGPIALGAMASMDRGVSAERGLVKTSMDARSVILSTLDGGPRDRNAAEVSAFLAACQPFLA